MFVYTLYIYLQDTIAHKAHEHIYNRTFIWMAPDDLTGPVVIK